MDDPYVYTMDETRSGPSQQWELLKQTRVDAYESQEAKAERVKMEQIKGDCAASVAHEATLGPRAQHVSAWDAEASDDESDPEDLDGDWLDELLQENDVVKTVEPRRNAHQEKMRRRAAARLQRREEKFQLCKELDEATQKCID